MSSSGPDQADPAPWPDRPALVPPVQRWRCCYCGGTGLDADGATCEHCQGLGHS
jgi:hypothetical protein